METIEQFLARGGKITKCETTVAEDIEIHQLRPLKATPRKRYVNPGLEASRDKNIAKNQAVSDAKYAKALELIPQLGKDATAIKLGLSPKSFDRWLRKCQKRQEKKR